MNSRRKTSITVLLYAFFGLIQTHGAAAQEGVRSAEVPKDFCVQAQQWIVGSALVAHNEVFDDFEAFTKSKPGVSPLMTTQYTWPERLPDGSAMRVSCKMKTADHLQSVYGREAAGEDIGCRGVNERLLQQTLNSMTEAERAQLAITPGVSLIFDDDIVTAQGPLWLEPYPMVRRQANTLIVQAKGMKNDWNDPRYAQAPPQFRGTRYCHLITPAYLRALLLGETVSAW